MPVSASLRRAVDFCAFGADRRDFLLNKAAFKRSPGAAGGFDLLKLRPSGGAELACQSFDGAGAGAGIGNLCEVGFFEQNKLRVARNPARESIGQAERGGVRQRGDIVGASQGRRR